MFGYHSAESQACRGSVAMLSSAPEGRDVSESLVRASHLCVLAMTHYHVYHCIQTEYYPQSSTGTESYLPEPVVCLVRASPSCTVAVKSRSLQKMGWTVLSVPYFHWQALTHPHMKQVSDHLLYFACTLQPYCLVWNVLHHGLGVLIP